jgi:signal transduction histidine kinase
VIFVPQVDRAALWHGFVSLVNVVARPLCGLLFGVVAHAEPIPLKSVEATFQGQVGGNLASVIDGIESGPQGWSVAPKVSEPQSLIVRCANLVEASELDITLFFHSGQPHASIAEFGLDYTTDAEPSLNGNWKPLEIHRHVAEIAYLDFLPIGRLRASIGTASGNKGGSPGDTYRVGAYMQKGRPSGFRLRVYPLRDSQGKPYAVGLSPNQDFVLTEFRVAKYTRATTNIALNRPVRSSHNVINGGTAPVALTDGLPSTFTHPASGNLGANFHYDIDLGRSAVLDHIVLRGRSGMSGGNRLSRVTVRLYENNPETGGSPLWEGVDRADGSFPAPGEYDVIDAGFGKGAFRGRYLRLSSDSPVPYSPQLAEVEVYESRTPELVSVLADGREISARGELNLPSGVRRLTVQLQIPQADMTSGDLFRWRLRGGTEEWKTSRTMTVDMPCPPYGQTLFEAQALHSDREWNTSILSLPIIRKHFWETLVFQSLAAVATLWGAMSLARFFAKRSSARQLALANARAALAEERTRIARDLHDDLGADLASIGLLTEIAGRSLDQPDDTRLQLEKIYEIADDLTRQLRAVVWTVDPENDPLESFASYLHGHAEDYLGMAGIRCHFTCAELMPEIHLSPTIRHPVLMIVKEALHNIIKHAAATVVTFRIAIEDGHLLIEIADNGRGMPPQEALKPGNGLANMRARAATIGAICEILPAATGSGTMVRFVLLLG